ncbi:MAG: hypothetical protein IH631_09555, partial [Candidatus Thorarchaeota archaeon]|nr:hypothetical protein [Candidatus Thorarchaeota archaeon]
MKRVVVLIVALLIALGAVPVGMEPFQIETDTGLPNGINQDSSVLSSASSSGMTYTSLAYMTQSVQSQTVQILNSYSNPTSHSGNLDFSNYQISGWNLYNITMEITSINAIAERESTGVSASTHIDIVNASGAITDVLYQAFYNQGHNGKLENYSLDYRAPFYDSGLGDAYLVIRSDYSDAQTNQTDYLTPFSQVGTYSTVTDDCSSQNVILNANQPYYAVFDGTALSGFYAGGWWFNTIYWRAANTLGVRTGYHYRNDPSMVYWYVYQGIPAINWEADFRYTYTPWNTSSNTAITYSDPSSVSLTGNSTA